MCDCPLLGLARERYPLHGRCFCPSLRLDLLPTFKYIGLEGRCVALTIWRVQYWRELLLLLASAAGGRARGGCSSVSCSAQLRKIQMRCGIFHCNLSGCSSCFVPLDVAGAEGGLSHLTTIPPLRPAQLGCRAP